MDRKKLLEELMQSIDIMRKRMFFRGADAKSRISPAQWMVMRIIAHHPDCTLKMIAEKLQITPSAATQLVDKLVQSRYVVRTDDPADRRRAIIALADKAASEVAALRTQSLKRMLHVFDALNDKELAQFVALHKKIAAHASKRI